MTRFTDRVRDELAHTPPGPVCCRRAELSAVLRLAGSLHLRGTGTSAAGPSEGMRPVWVVTLSANALARRVHAALSDLADVRPEVELHEATTLRPRRYVLTVVDRVAGTLSDLGVTDPALRAQDRVPAMIGTSHDVAAYLRGALLAAGSISDPLRSPHLEVRCPGPGVGDGIRRLLVRAGARGARVASRESEWRVSSKSGAEIGSVLTRTGAHSAFLEWDGARLRRELRGEANRAANADRANVSRAVQAAGRHVREIEAAVAATGWDALPDDLQETALARLANPEVSLAELAALHDPPLTKATVHRRLTRLRLLAGGEDAGNTAVE